MNFTKMQGAGNDFIFLRQEELPSVMDRARIAALCDRRCGIGADGLIALAPLPDGEIRFSYWNADGSPAEMCGNGLRCAMEFAADTGMVSGSSAVFATASGKRTAERLSPGLIRIGMGTPQPFREIRAEGWTCQCTNTGVPHAVVPVDSAGKICVRQEGRKIRYSAAFAPEGTNADFLEVRSPDQGILRTYERGVEAETPACGTGAAAAGFFLWKFYGGSEKKQLFCSGGDELTIEIAANGNMLPCIFLTGPAKKVFSGTIAE